MAFDLLRRVWRQGYATEVSWAVLDWARSSGYERVWATVWDWNTASRRVLAKLGFTERPTDWTEVDPVRGTTLSSPCDGSDATDVRRLGLLHQAPAGAALPPDRGAVTQPAPPALGRRTTAPQGTGSWSQASSEFTVLRIQAMKVWQFHQVRPSVSQAVVSAIFRGRRSMESSVATARS